MTKGILRFLSPGILLLTTTLAFTQPNFTKHVVSSNLSGAYWVYARDVDSDGKLDLVTAASQGISWWKGTGSGGFSQRSLGSLQSAWGAFAEDLNGDGKVDILGVSPTTDEVVWYKNNGGSFSSKKIIDAGGQDPESVAAADFDNDGDGDVVVALWEDGKIAWYENKGSSWVKHILDGNVSGAHSVYVADFNNDGKVDIVGSGSGSTRWYSNSGNGNFTRKTVGSGGSWSVFAYDVNQDGKKDILRTQRNNGDVDWFKNNGGSFSENNVAQNFGQSWSVSAGDIDGDGDVDIAAAGFDDNSVTAWLNNGNNSFGSGVTVDNVNVARAVFIADLDKDGNKDIAAAIRGDRDLNWYETNGGGGGSQESITLIAPDGGEALIAGQSFAISWNATNISNVDIDFSGDGGSTWTSVATGLNDTGSYQWTVPAVESQQCRIRVADAADGTPSDNSNNNFSISSVLETVRVSAPNGGETLVSGDTFTITWSSSGLATVDIDFSGDGGSTWTSVATGLNDTGSYQWTVPAVESQQCRIRVADAADGSPSDRSNKNFTISNGQKTILVTAPNGGEILEEKTTYKIKWNTTGQIDDVRIEFSSDAGGAWQTILASTNNDGQFNWTVPAWLSQFCLIRISDGSDATVTDVSDAIFEIIAAPTLAPIVLVFAPASAPPGDSVAITGENFVDVTGVYFNEAMADFQVISENEILTTVPAGATSGKVVVTTAAGTGESMSDFIVLPSGPVEYLTYQPGSDAQVRLSAREQNFGETDFLKVQKGKYISYLKFEIAGSDSQIVDAKIRLFARNAATSGGAIYKTANTLLGSVAPWEQDNLTADNAPALTGSPLGQVAAVAGSSFVDFNVTAAIDGPGIYSFAISSGSDELIRYDSKEANFAPELILTVPEKVKQAPVARNDEITIFEDSTAIVPILDNDNDADGGIASETVLLTSQPGFGSAFPDSVTGVVTYMPAGNFFGVDSFFYVVQDLDSLVSNEALVRIVVLPVNDTPVAVDDSASVAADTVVTINLLRNDYDVDDGVDSTSVVISQLPLHGVAFLDSLTGIVTYQPNATFAGVDSFFYEIKDFSSAVSNNAKVWLVVSGINHAPVIRAFQPEALHLVAEPADSIAFSIEVEDLDGDSLSYFWRLNGQPVSLANSYTFVVSEQALAAQTVDVRVSDNFSSDSLSWTIDVVTGVEDASTLPDAFHVSQNYPNPFNPETRIEFALPVTASVEVVVYDLLGRKVKTLLQGSRRPGFHFVNWDATNEQGRAVASGVYLYCVTAADFRFSGKMVLVQ